MNNIPDFLRVSPEMQKHFAKGGMIKRADGSYSRRGLWDNIRANRGSGRKPTKEMLEQENKIRAKEYEVGGSITFTAGGEKHRVYEKESPTGNGKGVQGHIMVNHPTMDKGKWDTIDLTEKSGARTVAEGVAATKQWHEENPEYGNGGYTVRKSHDRKGKTHVVIGPDGTKKYFGDSKLGQHPNDPARKKAFYARHKHNLEHNPYFRAFARATWADGGEVPEFDNGGYYGPFYNRTDAAKLQRWRSPMANSMTPSFDIGGNTSMLDPNVLDMDSIKNNINQQDTSSNTFRFDLNSNVPINQNTNTLPNYTSYDPNTWSGEKPATPNHEWDDAVKKEQDQSNTSSRNGLDAFMNPFSSKFENTINQLNVLSRISKRSNENANYNFAKSQNILPNTQNKTETYQGVEYAKHGGIIGGDLKEGQEIELTPTQMYLLEKKGYKFQII